MPRVNKMLNLLSDVYEKSNDTYISLLHQYLYTYNANLQTYTYNNQVFVYKENISPIITDKEIILYSDSLTRKYELVKSWDRVERWVIFDFGFKIKNLENKLNRVIIFVFFHIISQEIMMLKNPKISQADNVDLHDFSKNFTSTDKLKIGTDFLVHGNEWNKLYKGKWMTLPLDLEDKEIKCYFPKDKDNISNVLTYSRLVIITAWDTASYLVANNSFTYLALHIGWNYIYDDEIFEKLTNIESSITKEILTLPSIPKLKPHKYLNLNQVMADIFVVFHAINDVFIKNKRTAHKYSFLTDTVRKLFNIGMKVNMTNVSKYLSIIAPICFTAQKCRIQSTEEEIQQNQEEFTKMLLKKIEMYNIKIETV